MNVAIPIWQDRLSPVFDTAARLVVFEIGPDGPVLQAELPVTGQGLLSRLRVLRDANVECLLCGAISRGWCRQLEAAGIHVIPFLAGSWESLLKAYLDGCLDNHRFHMPGCRQGRCRRQKQRGTRNRKE